MELMDLIGAALSIPTEVRVGLAYCAVAALAFVAGLLAPVDR